jgi:hypothetical protein
VPPPPRIVLPRFYPTYVYLALWPIVTPLTLRRPPPIVTNATTRTCCVIVPQAQINGVNVTTLRGDGLLLHEGPAEVQGTVTVANGGVMGQQEALSGLHMLSANVSHPSNQA